MLEQRQYPGRNVHRHLALEMAATAPSAAYPQAMVRAIARIIAQGVTMEELYGEARLSFAVDIEHGVYPVEPQPMEQADQPDVPASEPERREQTAQQGIAADSSIIH